MTDYRATLDLSTKGSSPPQIRPSRRVWVYFAVTFLVAWFFWFLAWLFTKGQLGHIPLIPTLIVGSFGPFVGAAVCTWMEGGLRNTLRFFARAFRVRMGWVVFLVSFFLFPVLAIGTEFIHSRISHLPFTWTISWDQLPMAYLFLFFLGGTLGEEYGWSYLSDRLDDFLPLTQATALLGLVWAVWHLPLFFIVAPGLSQAYTPFYVFCVGAVSMRFIFSWTYHKGHSNILSNMLCHTATNLSFSIVSIAASPQQLGHDRNWYFIFLTAVSAALLWCLSPIGPATYTKRCPPSTSTTEPVTN